MGTPAPRRTLLAALAVAVVGLLVSVAMAVGTWSGRPSADVDDFGTALGSRPTAAQRALERTPEPAATEEAGTTASAAPTVREPSVPEPSVREPSVLELPRLGVRAPVDPVGVAADGQMEVPEDPRRVGWYRFSPRPGEATGSSVIVGHVDSERGDLGVLAGLSEVRQGDEVRIRRSDGSWVDFRVVSRRTVDKETLTGSGVYRRDGSAVLSLITCTGPYLPDKGGYQQNLVVTAVEAPT
ncbi:sortase domain-containing protein [Streptomyces sp. NPDC001595]|uniref:class F sortase n=1 Tax=Streptomyces sp. NPDC001532 TaxID=3154520 RepID=UPI003326395A